MYCPNCKIESKGKFCPKCGRNLTESSEHRKAKRSVGFLRNAMSFDEKWWLDLEYRIYKAVLVFYTIAAALVGTAGIIEGILTLVKSVSDGYVNGLFQGLLFLILSIPAAFLVWILLNVLTAPLINFLNMQKNIYEIKSTVNRMADKEEG